MGPADRGRRRVGAGRRGPTRWRSKPLRICERDVALSGEAPRQSQVLVLLPPTSGRHTPPRRRILSTTAARPEASVLALQEDWAVLVRPGRSALPSTCRGTRKHRDPVLGGASRPVQSANWRRVTRPYVWRARNMGRDPAVEEFPTIRAEPTPTLPRRPFLRLSQAGQGFSKSATFPLRTFLASAVAPRS